MSPPKLCGLKTWIWGAVIIASLVQIAAAFPIDDNGTVQVCRGLAFDGTNYLTLQQSASSVVAQLVSPTGAALGGEIKIGTNATFPPAVAVAFGNGMYLAVWSDSTKVTRTAYEADLFGQFIAPNGQKAAPPFPLLASVGAHGFQTLQAVAFGGGNFLVVWQDSLDKKFYGQLLTAAGTLSGTEFVISGQQQNGESAAIAFDGNRYFVVWQSNNGSTGNSNNTFGAFVSTSGSAGNPIQISQSASLDQDPLAVAWDGTNYLVVWDKDTRLNANGSPADWTLYGRLIGADGSFSGSEVALRTNPGNQAFPSLSFGGGQYLLVWTAYTNLVPTTLATLAGQYFDIAGNPAGAQFTPLPVEKAGEGMFCLRGLAYDGFRFALAATAVSLRGNATNITGLFGGYLFGAFIPSSYAPPKIDVQPAAVAGLAGTVAAFAVTAEGSALSYQWSKNNRPIPAGSRLSGIAGSTLVISNAAVADAGSYSVVVSNLFGSVTSSIATLTVQVPAVVTTAVSPPNTGAVSGGGRYYSGSNVTLNAVGSNTCNTFVKWTVGGRTVGTNSTYTFTPAGNETVVANFSQAAYRIVTTSVPVQGGATSGGAVKTCGSTVTVTATANPGFQFFYWSLASTGENLSTNTTFIFTAEGNETLKANFGDVAPPTIAITSPVSGFQTTNAALTMSGTALDNVGVQAVYWRIGPNGYWAAAQTANAWSNWTAAVSLSAGTNIVQAYAVDTSGNASTVAAVTVIHQGPVAGLVPLSLSGLVGLMTGEGGGDTNEISFGTSTAVSVSLGANGPGVGNYTYMATGSNTAQLFVSDIAPPSRAGRTTTMDLTFSDPSNALFTNSDGSAGTLILDSPAGLSPASLSGVTLEISQADGSPSTLVFKDGVFSGAGASGTYTYSRYSPVAGMVELIYPAVPGLNNFITISFSATNNGIYCAESYNGSAGPAPMETAGTLTVRGIASPTGEIAPASLDGMTATVTGSKGTDALNFGPATYGVASLSETNPTVGVANYTYTRTGPKTATLQARFIAPPTLTNNDATLTALTFTDGQHAEGVDSLGTNFFTFAPATNMAPAWLTGKTLALSGETGVRTFGDGAFTAPGGSGTYTYAMYGPSVAIVQLIYTDSANTGVTEYLQLAFPTADSGTFYSSRINASGNGVIQTGTFTSQHWNTSPTSIRSLPPIR